MNIGPTIPEKRAIGAGDGSRTRDIQLGRLTLCQLSYSRLTADIVSDEGRDRVSALRLKPASEIDRSTSRAHPVHCVVDAVLTRLDSDV